MHKIKQIQLLESQARVLQQIESFIFDSDDRIFISKGYAGTGKTTLMRFLIDYLQKYNRRYRLLASTGRAAKVLSNITNVTESVITIHKLIYKYDGLNKDLSEIKESAANEDYGQLCLNFAFSEVDDEKEPEAIYIADEASMISDQPEDFVTQAKFGSGKVLTDLLNYDKRKNSKFIFVGDPCQLPPIRECSSPALSKENFKEHFKMNAQEAQLTEIVRTGKDNSLIMASNKLRSLYASAPERKDAYGTLKVWGNLPLGNNKNIILHPNADEMIQEYIQKIKEKKYDNAVYICWSNARCKKVSLEVRSALGLNGLLCRGDLLLVIQNNYLNGLMNGDMVEVLNVSSITETVAGLTFRQVKVKELFTGITCDALLIDEILMQDHVNLDSDQMTRLYIDFVIRMKKKGIKQKMPDEFKFAMANDPYLNALRCVYGYAVTCHKAQGGEWDDVYVEIPRNITFQPIKESYQWVYTAITRARNKVHIVKDFFIK
ncbi:MAG: ATP-dependent helicase [Bacteroidales bacterium]|jgi:ATP-dependent exoDNAse (exonuclease V) alpha subunit|nr:ATP-dependent helicase [Bacteroidales bacterium]MCI2133518.1 ATP-dependent helicase [Bacteroidales bacterium]